MSTKKPSRGYLVDLVVNKYFVNVDRHNMQLVLDCFTSDEVFTIQSAFTDHQWRGTGLRKYKTSVHKDFHHVSDVKEDYQWTKNVRVQQPRGAAMMRALHQMVDDEPSNS